MNKITVMCNTSPIIGLLTIERLDLLPQLFEQIIIPDAVYRELCGDNHEHEHEIKQIQKYINQGIIETYTVKNEGAVKELYGRLHYGELEVIIGAKELQIPLAIIDERAARKVAADFLVDTIGILGILTLAKKQGILKCIKPDVDMLREKGYRIGDELYLQILKQNNEI